VASRPRIVFAWTSLDVDSQVLRGMLWLLVIEVAAVAGFFGAQLSGLVARAGRLLETFGVVDDASRATQLGEALRGYYRREWRRFGLSVAFHLAGWLLGALEAVVMLWALGIDASAVTATVIEALGSGVRFATFLVPASLGAGAGLAFSLVRRARQVVWVVVGIGVLLAMRAKSTRSDKA